MGDEPPRQTDERMEGSGREKGFSPVEDARSDDARRPSGGTSSAAVSRPLANGPFSPGARHPLFLPHLTDHDPANADFCEDGGILGDMSIFDLAGPSNETSEATSASVVPEEELRKLPFIRRWALRVTSHQDFELAIVVLIIGNCLSMAAHNPAIGSDEGRNHIVGILELVFNSCFTVEVLLHVLAGGGLFAYLNSWWNTFDFVMVLFGYTAFLPEGSGESASGIRALRALRALRPLRTISHFKTLRSVIVCFFEAMPLLMSVCGLLVFFLFLYSIVGIHMFQSALHHTCVDDVSGEFETAPGMELYEFGCGTRPCPEGFTCKEHNEKLLASAASFDNVGVAMLTVFQVINISGWSYILYRIMDGSNASVVIYFITAIILGSYVLTNLFLAVLKLKFARVQAFQREPTDQPAAPERKNALQKLFAFLSMQLARMRNRRRSGQAPQLEEGDLPGPGAPAQWQPPGPGASTYACWRYKTHQLIHRSSFNQFFLGCIVVAILLLAAEHDGMDARLEQVLFWSNLVLNVMFTAEVVLKMWGLGMKMFVKDGYNIFDTVVVAISLSDLAVVGQGSISALGSLRVLRILKSFRVLRVIKMFRYLQSLRRISDVLVDSASTFFAIGLLVLLFLMVFTIVGLHLYGAQSTTSTFPNFNNLFNTFCLVFQVLTLEDWDIMMHETIRATNYSTALFFIAWVVLGKYIFLTLFLAVVMEAFEASFEKERREHVGSAHDEAGADAAPADTHDDDAAICTDVLEAHHPNQKQLPLHQAHLAHNKVAPHPNECNAAANPKRKPGRESSAVSFGAQPDKQRRSSPLLLLPQDGYAHPNSGQAGAAGPAAGTASGTCLDADAYMPLADSDTSSEGGGVEGADIDSLRGATDVHSLQERPEGVPALQLAVLTTTRAGSREEELEKECVRTREGTAPQQQARTPGGSATPREVDIALGLSAMLPQLSPRSLQPELGERTGGEAVSEGVVGLGGSMGDVGMGMIEEELSFRPTTAPGAPISDGNTALIQLSRRAPGGQQQQQQQPRRRLQVRGEPAAAAPSWQGVSEGGEDLPAPIAAAPPLMEKGPAHVLQVGVPGSTSTAGECARRGGVDNREKQAELMRALERHLSSQVDAAGGERDAVLSGELSSVGMSASVFNDLLFQNPPITPRGRAGQGESNRLERVHNRVLAAALQLGRRCKEQDRKELGELESNKVKTFLQHPTFKVMATDVFDHNKVTSNWERMKSFVGTKLQLIATPRAGQSNAEPEKSEDVASVALSAFEFRTSSLAQLAALERPGDSFRSAVVPAGPPAGESCSGTGVASPQSPPVRQASPLQELWSESSDLELGGRSFGLFGPESLIRRFAHRIVSHRYYSMLMTVAILASCVAMVLEHPRLDSSSMVSRALAVLEIIFIILFGLESILKALAFTLTKYLRQTTNIIDVTIVISSILLLLLERVDLKFVKGLRVLRAVKPLRIVTRSTGMQTVVNSIITSVVSMANVSVIVVMMCLVFGILGVQLFSGRFYRCNDESVGFETECVGSFVDPDSGELTDRTWTNPFLNFDHLGSALFTLFITITLDGYTEIMVNAMSVTTKGQQPRFMANPMAFFFFFAFIVVCAFTLMNLYMGVIFYQFTTLRAQEQGNDLLTPSQKQWLEMSRYVFSMKPVIVNSKPTSTWRKAVFEIVVHDHFETAITLVIVVNIGFMTGTFYDQPELWSSIQESANLVFTAVFVLEMILKIIGLGWSQYIKSRWNRFDFFLVVSSVVDLSVSYLADSFLGVLRVLRVQKLLRLLRVSRMFKLMKSLKGVQALLLTLVTSLPSLWHVVALVALVFFMFAYMGMLLIGEVQHGAHMNDHANFDTVPKAALTLLRVATNDAWSGIMQDAMVSPPDCDPDRELDGCGTVMAVPYFMLFVLVLTFMMLNLFTTIVIQNFETLESREAWKVKPDVLEYVVSLWAQLDDGSGTITLLELCQLLRKVPAPLGIARVRGSLLQRPRTEDAELMMARAQLRTMIIPRLQGDRLPFPHTMYELVRHCAEVVLPGHLGVAGEHEAETKHFFKRINMEYMVGVEHIQRATCFMDQERGVKGM